MKWPLTRFSYRYHKIMKYYKYAINDFISLMINRAYLNVKSNISKTISLKS